VSVTVTLYAWWLWVYFAAGAVLCLPMMAYAETQMSGPFDWRHAFWRARYHAESPRRRTVKALLGYVVVIAAWPLALVELVR
jgi:hypothetical protein